MMTNLSSRVLNNIVSRSVILPITFKQRKNKKDKKCNEDELIVIISKDNKEWTRFSNWAIPFSGCYTREMEWSDDVNKVIDSIQDLDNTYVDLVSRDFFEEFKCPFV